MSRPTFEAPKIALIHYDLWSPRVTFEVTCRLHVLCRAQVSCDFATRLSLISDLTSLKSASFDVSPSSLNKPGKHWEQQAYDALRATLSPERALQLLRERTLEALAACETKIPGWLLVECAHACEAQHRSKAQELTHLQARCAELQREINRYAQLEAAAKQSASERATAAKSRQSELLQRARGLWRVETDTSETHESRAKLGPTGGLFARIDSAQILTIGEEFSADGEHRSVTFFSAKFTDRQAAMTTLQLWCG